MSFEPTKKRADQERRTQNSLLHGSDIYTNHSKRLKFSYVPSPQQLQSQLNDATRSNSGSRIEIFFSKDTGNYLLSLEYKKAVGVASWTLRYNNSGPAIWEKQSNDAQEIHNCLVDGLLEAERSGPKLNQTELISSLQKFLGRADADVQQTISKSPLVKAEIRNVIELDLGRQALESLLIKDAHIFSYPLFLFSLLREHAWALDTETSFSIILISIFDEGTNASVPKPVIIEILNTINRSKRKTDILGEYVTSNTFGIILPETDEKGCEGFLDRIEKELLVCSPLLELAAEGAKQSTNIQTLEGDLRKLPMPNLLQTISMSKLTGSLQIKSSAATAEVFFNDGEVVHCLSGDNQGESAFVELIGWEAGKFWFYPAPKTEIRTINRRLDLLIMQGIQHTDQFKYLKANGLKMKAVLKRVNESITNAEFEELLASGTGIDILDQKRFYESVDNQTELIYLLQAQKLNQSQWVPILYNLFNCGLIDFRRTSKETTNNQLNTRNRPSNWTQTLERQLPGRIKMLAASSSYGPNCETLSKMLGAAEMTMSKVKELGLSRGSFSGLFPLASPPEKAVDLSPVQDLSDKLMVEELGIFSYATMVSFIEQECHRANRNKKACYVLLISVLANDTQSLETSSLDHAVKTLVSNIENLEWKNHLLGQFSINTLMMMFPKATNRDLKCIASQLESMDLELLVGADSTNYRIEVHVCLATIDLTHGRNLIIIDA